jgi:predicted nucleic acid-binding protein
VRLIDANVFMYAAGAEHPHKAASIRFLERVARDEVEAAIDAEVLQEILHRYRSIGRWSEGRRVYDHARRIVPLVVAITPIELDEAVELLDRYPGIWARDALHAAVALLHFEGRVCSYDRDLDEIEGITRTEPS